MKKNFYYHLYKSISKGKYVFLTLIIMNASLCVHAQNQIIKLSGSQMTVSLVIKAIQKQTGLSVDYSQNALNTGERINISSKTVKLSSLLDDILSPQGLGYEIQDRHVIITAAKVGNNNTIQPKTTGKKKITGHVVDSQGEPIIGASIIERGTSNGTVTDLDGNFSIEVKNNSRIAISYIGYSTKEYNTANVSKLSVAMHEDDKSLEEVVVVGYGSMKKSDLTSSISSVGSKVIGQASTTNLSDVLQGKVPGMDIQSERYDGENRNIYIRGSRSLNASNTPLTIVDGVPASMNDVNIHDIESIEVMKDASSAAVYGSQGANGVIIITTKRGKAGSTRISYDGYYGIEKPVFMDMMSGDRFVQMKRDAYLMANNLWSKGNKGTVDDSILFTDDEQNIISTRNYVDWYDLIYRNGSIQSNTVTINGGNEKTKFNISVDYDYNKGYVKTNETKTIYVNTSIDHTINKWASIGATIRFKSRNNSGFATYGQAIFYGTPIDRAYDDNGNLIEIPNSNEGAYNILLNYQNGQYVNDNKAQKTNFLVFSDIKFFKDLTMHTNVGYNISSERTGYFFGSDSYTSHGLNKSGRTSNYDYQLTANNTLTYLHQFGNHKLTADFVQEIQKYEYDDMSATGEKEDVEYLSYYNLATNLQNKNIGSGYSRWTMASLMGRLRYDYKGKYLFNASIRDDGSSRLADGHKWGSFISGGAAWRLSSEDFLKNCNWISNLKLRLSYGEVGNQAINVYQTIETLSSYPVLFGETGVYSYRPDKLVNTNLGWETTKTTNIGLDFGFFRDRITGNIDIYKSSTSDLLMQRSLPETSGFSKIYDNIGSTENKGLEFAINADIVRTSKITWDIYGTFAYNKNKITKLATKEDDITNGWFVGHPISAIYDYKKEGIWQLGEEKEAAKYNCVPGDIKIKDQEGTSKGITSDDKVFIGQTDPKYIASFGSNLTYKNLDISINLSGRFGHMIYCDAYGYNLITSGNRWCVDVDYWTPDNPSNRWPRASNDIANRNLCAYFKGDYIKLQDMTIGYDLASLLKKYTNISISKARFYCQIRNFAYLYNAAGHHINPESSSYEITVPKCFNFGLNINF